MTARKPAASAIPIDPKLPPDFDDTPNDARPKSHLQWWDRPYVVTYTWEQMVAGTAEAPDVVERRRAQWFKAWPTGTRYDVRCLDGDAWDRSTWWGSYPTIEEALGAAAARAQSRRGPCEDGDA